MNELYVVSIFLGLVGILGWVLPYGWDILRPRFFSNMSALPRTFGTVLSAISSLLVVISVAVSTLAFIYLQPDERGIPVTIRNLDHENVSYVRLLFPEGDVVATSAEDLKKNSEVVLYLKPDVVGRLKVEYRIQGLDYASVFDFGKQIGPTSIGNIEFTFKSDGTHSLLDGIIGT